MSRPARLNSCRRFAGLTFSSAFANRQASCKWRTIHTETRRGTSLERPRKLSPLLLAAAGGTVAAGVLALTDDLHHGYTAAARTGRVLSTLALCINEYCCLHHLKHELTLRSFSYRVTLNHQTKDAVESATLLKQCHKRCAERTLRAMEKNGSIFIKLGQHLSSLNYMLPVEWTSTFIPLQDRCPVSPYESIEAMFQTDTGLSLWEMFSDFDPQPIGAASLAQVHRATMKETGQTVAVKVQHPELEEWVPLDLALTRLTFSTLKRFFPDYDLEWLSDEMEFSLPQELDFSREGENAIRAKEYFSHVDEPALIIPGGA